MEVETLVVGGEFSADFSGKSQRPHQNGTTKTLCRGLPIRGRIVRPLIVYAAASPYSHVRRPLGGLFDHTVCDVRGIRWLKLPLKKDGAVADTEIDVRDECVNAKLLE
ncbi:hypothetical protein FOPG_18534 [Fusarium oxysporum f. sp. conglutinans race 2 54008]|uniref:Uncharacterized protein n=1 Tax=Fusarium oxysporum f. sp. conglutinans race 2 54008 TaxID=1089457 RepID=X0GNM3_FUSOX|nr:hypothetical protein FOPG_18534 [Fusarium oxysporum f. sp. conglutinans race 2 54008]